MKASGFFHGYDPETGTERDELAAYLETDEGRAAVEAHDRHWSECMRVAEEHGFISQAAGGAAIVTTNGAYMEANGAEALAKRLRMCDIDL